MTFLPQVVVIWSQNVDVQLFSTFFFFFFRFEEFVAEQEGTGTYLKYIYTATNDLRQGKRCSHTLLETGQAWK